MADKQKQVYRRISILVPLNPPASQEKRQRNKKLYYLLRWLRYGLHRGQGNSYCRIESQDAPPAMPHGAYQLSAQIQSKLQGFLLSSLFTGFIARMKAESIAPAVYLVGHKTNGEDVALPPIRICGDWPKPLALPIPMRGTEIDLYHTPCFARHMLTAVVDTPLSQYPVK